LGHLKKYKTAAHSQSSDPTETSQSSSESRIGTRISFVSQEPRGPISFPLDAMSLPGAAQEGAASQRDSLPTSASGFVKLPGSDLSLPSKIRRQDTFGDEFYESWDRGVSVEPVDSLLEGGDENGNLSFTSPAAVGEGGQKRYREESEAEEGSEGEDSVELRNEMEKWKRLAAELQDQVVHLRATAASQSSSSANGGGEQSQRKKSKKGLRYHDSVLAQEQESPKPQHQSPGPQGAPQGGEQGESRRQSKATPPPKPKKSPKAKS
jgi:hypothetical protein